MSRSIRWLAALLVAGLHLMQAAAQQPSKAEIARQAKAATAFVEVNGAFKQGTAFCIHETGYFLTNQHVVGAVTEVKLVLNPGLKDKKVVPARVVRTDKALDLALLKVDEKTMFLSLPLGSSEGLTELAEVIAVGFPFGTALAPEKGEYPAVSVNLGRITSLRMKKGELDRIQMDAVVNPGNSGGPVLDAKGQVIGVVVSGVRGTAVNFAIPVSHVHRFAATPDVQITPPTIAYANRYKPAEIEARVTSLVPLKSAYDVELRVGAKGKERELKMTLNNGVYRSKAELLRRAPGPRIALNFDDGKIEGCVKDCIFTVGNDKFKLSEVRSLRFGAQPSATRADGKTAAGAIKGLEELAINLGDATVPVKTGKAVDLTVAPPVDEARVHFTVIVRRDNQELARIQDFFWFKDAPGQKGVDLGGEAKKLDGLWVLEKHEANGGSYPINEEAILIEGRQVRWVKSDGKTSPALPKGQLTIDPTKKPMTIDLRVNNKTWQGIYKIEGNRLTIGTNCNDEKRPSEFTTRLFAGPERSTFLRTYKREKKSE